MKRILVNFLKYNKIAYALYYHGMSFFINILKLFVRTDDKLILFNSFAGRKFDDSPKAIFDVMKLDPRFKDYKLVWAFHEPDKFDVPLKIKTDGVAYFKTALAARVWVTNSSVERGLSFKGKNTFYLNTWHGSPIKKIGSDIFSGNQAFRSKGKNHVDIMNTQSNFEADVFTKCFGIPRDHLIEVGLPRNDALVNHTEAERERIRERLGLSSDKKVILYCPTFREYAKDANLGVVLAPPMDLNKWDNQLSDHYILLFRAHYEVSKVMKVPANGFVRNVTDYPILNDLMIASDILISDYSSIFFDYSLMDKCMLHFTYDFDKYEEKRGMYFDIREYISGAATEDGVIAILKAFEQKKELKKTIAFRNKFMNFYGEASKKTVDYIAQSILTGGDCQ